MQSNIHRHDDDSESSSCRQWRRPYAAWRGGERADRERGQGASEGMESLGAQFWRSRGAGRRVAMEVGALLVHGFHDTIFANTWRATECQSCDAIFGKFHADLDLGACSKVALLWMLLDLYIGSRTIRAMD